MGRILSRLRAASGMSQDAAGKLIDLSAQTIGRLEEGLPTTIGPLHIKALCDGYGATAEERETLLSLVREVKEAQRAGGSWWRRYSDVIHTDFNHYLALEEAASRITMWQTTFLPGPFQIPGYRRQTLWASRPDLPPDAVEKRIEVATMRQNRLQDPAFRMDAILSESVLRYEIGGRGVMRDQLLHLAEIMLLPNVSVRVVRFGASGILGLVTGSFVLLEFPLLPSTKLAEPPVVYVEEWKGSLYLDQEPEVGDYRRAADEISRVALTDDDTRRLVLEIAEEFAQ
ncbi:XRE family transcriptional regulator [Nocardia terpenica]|uniref:XRE family transcriptional regulator n=2 Tax=Nocardia terpenica TaxID=455432 RepID=A0A291RU32_9NOCA|nr:helix-turn-helix transcriptional regulator [Nocardia terpenica]ATL70758.1 XRE family transcriptional regulator [Nocardia terpenica]